MNKDEQIKESIEFCNDIYIYLEKESDSKADSWNEQFITRNESAASSILETSGVRQWEELEDGEDSYESSYENAFDNSSEDLREVDDEFEEEFDEVSDEALEDEEKEKRRLGHVLTFHFACVISCVLMAMICAKLTSSYAVQITTVNGTSMENTIMEQDKILVDKVSYNLREPQRYEVIVFHKAEQKNLIKRVIGMPGETVTIKNGNIYINGKQLLEDYGAEPMEESARAVTLELGDDEYFVLGDNRNVSMDSRNESIGAVKKSEIIGRAFMRVYPFTNIKKVS